MDDGRTTSEIKKTELQIARVKLATQVVLFLIAVVGLVVLLVRASGTTPKESRPGCTSRIGVPYLSRVELVPKDPPRKAMNGPSPRTVQTVRE